MAIEKAFDRAPGKAASPARAAAGDGLGPHAQELGATPGREELVAACSFDFTTGSFPSGELHVVSYEGVEQLSALYHFDIHALVDQDDYDELERKLLGSRGTLTLGGHLAAQREVHGVVSRVDIEGMTGDRLGRHAVRLRLAPALRALRHRRNSRIYQNMTAPAIAASLLDEHGLKHLWRLTRDYVARDYSVQYQETDYEFLRRILADDGIFFCFGHAAGEKEERIIFSDTSATCQGLEGLGALAFCDSEGEMFDRGDSVKRFARQVRVRPGATRVQRYDFVRPRFDEHAEEQAGATSGASGPTDLLVYDHEQVFDQVPADRALARQHLEQHRRRARVAAGESRCRALEVGKIVELTGNPVRGLDGRYLLLRVEHAAKRPEYTGGQITAETYRNRFDCVPADVTPRPRRRKRVLRQVLETATVVGPTGSEIHTDKYGRIKVQFHWDRDGNRDERSSCWLRTMQSWAGSGWGFQFIPRVDMEVLVQFLGGDTDSPIVVGCAYNGLNGPPFLLPQHKTVSGIRTRSSRGGGGFNELSFEDRKDYERVYLHAQKDLDELVEHNHTKTVLNDEVVRVGDCQTVQVGVNRTDLVGGNAGYAVGADRSTNVAADDSLTVGGKRELVVRSSLRELVACDASRFVDQDVYLSAGGDYRVTVKHDYDVVVGSDTPEYEGARASTASAGISVFGDLRFVATQQLRLHATDGIQIRCQDSVLDIKPDEIVLRSKKLTLLGAEQIFLDNGANELRLDDTSTLTAKKVELHSTAASLVLDANAALDGALVKLNCGPGAPPTPAEAATAESALETLSLELRDEHGNLYANREYLLMVEGSSYQGTTGGDGSLQQKIPKTAKTASLTVWIGKRDRRCYDISIEDEWPPVSEIRGAQIRLRNLGYLDGAISGELDAHTAAALQEFQEDQKLAVTGELDGPTQARIEQRTS